MDARRNQVYAAFYMWENGKLIRLTDHMAERDVYKRQIHAIMLSAVTDGGIGRGIEFCGNGTAVNRPTARCIAQRCQIG